MLYQLRLCAQEGDFERLTGLLSLLAQEGWQEETLPTGETCFILYAPTETPLQDIAKRCLEAAPESAYRIRPVEDEDWQKRWRDSLTPIPSGKFYIVPCTEEESLAEKLATTNIDLADTIPVAIEPKNAFGTGEHPTTHLCLLLLSKVTEDKSLPAPRAERTVLDLGTGSGILAIAAAKLGYTVLGLDIDKDAVKNAEENAAKNACSAKTTFAVGCEHDLGQASYDLIFANILARPLKDMAESLARALSPEGVLLLSGFLTEQADDVAQAYAACGLNLTRTDEGEWSALLARRS